MPPMTTNVVNITLPPVPVAPRVVGTLDINAMYAEGQLVHNIGPNCWAGYVLDAADAGCIVFIPGVKAKSF